MTVYGIRKLVLKMRSLIQEDWSEKMLHGIMMSDSSDMAEGLSTLCFQ